jgi:hypothetical protein
MAEPFPDRYAPGRCLTAALTWGCAPGGEVPLPTALLPGDQRPGLVIGSDLIYTASVVRPLMQTVHALLTRPRPDRWG